MRSAASRSASPNQMKRVSFVTASNTIERLLNFSNGEEVLVSSCVNSTVKVTPGRKNCCPVCAF